MAAKQELPKWNRVFASLRGTSCVVIESFPLHNNTTFDSTPRDQVREIISLLREQKSSSPNSNDQMSILGFDHNGMLGIFNALSMMNDQKDPALEGIDLSNITVFELDAPSHNVTVDKRSSLKLIALERGELVHPMHPTPAH